MDSGSSKGFDFASDDILCSYEDYTNQDNSNGNHSDSAIGTNSSKEFHKSRMSRPSVFPASSYSPPDDSGNQDVVIAAVERSMKKHSDNLMRFLEGLSSRLSQLELYCYNVDKSIGEMRSDLARDHGESEAKLKFLEKHLQEVHRSVQIIRDKQELADTQKELAKLQLAQKESSAGHDSQKSGETSPVPSDTKRNDNAAEGHGQQLALALPHQVAPLPAPQPAAPQPQMAPQPMSQSQTYYLSPSQLPNIPAPTQLTQNHYLQSDPHYQNPPPQRSQVSQPQPQPQPQVHSLPQYQQQWAQQVSQQVQPPQPAVRPSSPQVFPPYLQSQQVNPSTPETLPNSMPMQMPYSGIPQPSSSQAMTYAFGGPGRTPQQPSQHLKPGFGGQQNDGYVAGGHSNVPQGNTYMMYDSEGGRVPHASHPTHFSQSVYPPNPQQNSGSSMMARPPPQFMRSHPYNELIDKLGSMGFRGEHVISVIQRLEENGQTVDFNTVLDRLNVHPSGGSQRGWSG
ncbi:putative uncharacterized protein DDB_G0294196 isoform X1 [Cynara cardunculus var. scolymus]|uniref:DUF1421 domain-containing protein n=2 Tax=Cynara cardunculus var. scolymus TaxID=59895 RepID=A0A124SDE2_CYNCS|nr:putative uncharacterized protein DDB_G0294196 isoform X1 [Cynara cardunculus var. scolymus]KVH96655.1 Protein of unknown function DUF1421 [Cynara cardunculus var. scolymus]